MGCIYSPMPKFQRRYAKLSLKFGYAWGITFHCLMLMQLLIYILCRFWLKYFIWAQKEPQKRCNALQWPRPTFRGVWCRCQVIGMLTCVIISGKFHSILCIQVFRYWHGKCGAISWTLFEIFFKVAQSTKTWSNFFIVFKRCPRNPWIVLLSLLGTNGNSYF